MKLRAVAVFRRFGFALMASGLWAAAVQAALTPADSSTFTHKYEANSLPQNEDSIYAQLLNYIPSVSNGILSYDTTAGGPAGGLIWDAASAWGSEHVSGGAFTIEMRARVLDSLGDRTGLQIWVGGPSGDGSIAYNIGKDSVGYYGPGDVLLANTFDNSTNFHTYRIARESGSPDYHFYRDSEKLGVRQAGEFSFGPDLYFGDGSSSGGAKVEIDYFRWTTSGAYSPQPGLSRGQQVLLKQGLQIQAVAYPPGAIEGHTTGVTDFGRWQSSNFTALNSWWYPMPDTLAQMPAGQKWGRAWFGGPDPNLPYALTEQEMAYVDGFSSMMYHDEPTNDMFMSEYWMNSWRDYYAYWNEHYPNALTFTDFRYDTPVDLVTNYMQFAKPDMLVFNAYPSSPASRDYWYAAMQKYRTLALAGNDGTGQQPIPYGQFLWLSRNGSNYSAPVPSESLVRLNQFAGWAFGFKWASGWIYTTGGVDYSALFSTDGDTSPTPVFGYVAEANRQSLHLGPALVRFLSTDARMIPGRNGSFFNSLPDGISAWSRGTADTGGYTDHIYSIQPTTMQGGANDTTYSDIVIGYFKPLLEDNGGITFVDGLHFMIVNGAMTGTAAGSAQWYRITFDFTGSTFDSLVRLSRETGQVELVALTHTTGSFYHLDLNLPGGTGDLFGFWNSNDPLPRIVAQPGDFDGDGDVDGADFVAWQTHFPTASGATLAMGDADGDGDVDGADFVVWQTNFPTAPGAGTLATPEPCTWMLLAIGYFLVGNCRGFLRDGTILKTLRLEQARNRS